MRKRLVLLVVLALALPVTSVAASRVGDGTLSVDDGRGKVNVRARGGIIGRLDRGSVTIFDLTPNDAFEPVVSGDDQPILEVGENGLRYRGTGLRFRVIGGNFRIVVQGRGIDLSVVGRGEGFIEGDTLDPGVYSLDGADCRRERESCDPLPDPGIRFRLGPPPERPERNATRPSSE
ncbi:MAG: hypothetical protein ACRDNB_07910 [Gaiellaceae bacterium]